MRKIVHVDLDAFYASVEQRDDPHYRGKPLAVGSLPEQRGVVAAASYEARAFGIHSAMSSRIAKQRCPDLIFVQPRFEIYRAISAQIYAVFERYTDCFEPVALDEAYLDVTQNLSELSYASTIASYASTIARHIRADILKETGLTSSAGVSFNKFLAKMVSGLDKPNGLSVILPAQAAAFFVEALPIQKFHGIGRVTGQCMKDLGIHTGADLKARSETELVQHCGKAGHYYFNIARARGDRAVEANRIRKSVGAETSFAEDLSDPMKMVQELEAIAQTLKQRLDRHQAFGRSLTLKVKFADYQQVTRSRTLVTSIGELDVIASLAQALFSAINLEHRSIRLLGLSISNLDSLEASPTIQLPLFEVGCV